MSILNLAIWITSNPIITSHPPELFYDVVSDVSQYSKFVPYCTRSFINARDQALQPTEAGLRVGWKSFDEEFVCNLQCDPKKVVIAESVTHSLFEHLYTKWTITPNARKNSCDMELLLKFNFKSALYNRVSSLFAESVSELVIKAFDKRAAQLRREMMKQERAWIEFKIHYRNSHN